VVALFPVWSFGVDMAYAHLRKNFKDKQINNIMPSMIFLLGRCLNYQWLKNV